MQCEEEHTHSGQFLRADVSGQVSEPYGQVRSGRGNRFTQVKVIQVVCRGREREKEREKRKLKRKIRLKKGYFLLQPLFSIPDYFFTFKAQCLCLKAVVYTLLKKPCLGHLYSRNLRDVNYTQVIL